MFRRLQRSAAAAHVTGVSDTHTALPPLPAYDVRRAGDLLALRSWTEHARRAARVAVLLGTDTLSGVVGVATAVATWGLVDGGGARPVPNVVPLLSMVCCIQPLALRAVGAYGGGHARTSLSRVASGLTIAVLAGWLQAQLFGRITPDLPNKTAYLYSAAFIVPYAWGARLLSAWVVRRVHRLGLLQRRILLIGHRHDVEAVQRRIDHDAASEIRVVRAISPQDLVADLGALDVALASSRVDGVVVAGGLTAHMVEQVVARCVVGRVSVSLLPNGVQSLGPVSFALRPSSLGLLVQVSPLRFGLPQLALKRATDLLMTIAGLAVIWPVLVAVAAAVKFDSKGPILFSQTRMGVGGRSFRMFKFRTMVVGADTMKAQLAHLNEYPDGRLFKIKEDPRVTRVGRFLRRTSLDELPQLWNVLRGDMSLVGPRPCVPSELREYSPQHLVRLHVLPGVTGPWQVNGRNEVLDFEEVVRMEQEYIRSWSLPTDLLILVKTVPALLGRGAY